MFSVTDTFIVNQILTYTGSGGPLDNYLTNQSTIQDLYDILYDVIVTQYPYQSENPGPYLDRQRDFNVGWVQLENGINTSASGHNLRIATNNNNGGNAVLKQSKDTEDILNRDQLALNKKLTTNETRFAYGLSLARQQAKSYEVAAQNAYDYTVWNIGVIREIDDFDKNFWAAFAQGSWSPNLGYIPLKNLGNVVTRTDAVNKVLGDILHEINLAYNYILKEYPMATPPDKNKVFQHLIQHVHVAVNDLPRKVVEARNELNLLERDMEIQHNKNLQHASQDPHQAQHVAKVYYLGVVKNYLSDKGFGFIQAGLNSDVFFHISTVQHPLNNTIQAGDRVRFYMKQTNRGLEAVSVFA
jgi:cold shock CspA family protein